MTGRREDEMLTDALPAGWRWAFIVVSWLTTAFFVWLVVSLRRIEGWGALGAAAVLVWSVVASGVIGGVGLLLCARAYHLQRRVSIALALATLVAATPVSYFLVRRALR